MFRNYEFGKSANVVTGSVDTRAQVVFRTVDETYDVGILFDRTRFTEVAKLRTLAVLAVSATRLNASVELRKGNNRDVEFLGELF